MRQRSRELRRAMTPAEVRLWRGLRGWGLGRWRRQHPVGRFILDFYCARARLCIEVDGGIHDHPVQQARDQERSAHLQTLGIRVLRFTNERVLSDTRAVLHHIKDILEGHEAPEHERPPPGAERARPSPKRARR